MAPETIVLLHGFTQTGRSWEPTGAALGERYRALAPDLRGHGTATDARPVSFEAVRDDVLGLAPPHFALAGYSMGGRIALSLALAAPERVTRLVLVGASPGIAESAERSARRRTDEALADRIEREGIEAFAAHWSSLPLFAAQPADVAAGAHATRLAQSPAGLAAALRGLGTGVMEPLWAQLPQLTIPVTLIVGERDAKFRAIAERMAGSLPDATLHVVPGAGHAVQLEAPNAVAALLAP
ncbi:MAG TPA: 2-succinyl-6-hydroxy-2,4-cyclohexadiene-1-carboxylate synthase [Conexibacter sp.]|nr:2-succinyl-6-hydroxy-2,4-cyclohexadiene-1-carboxylate synthase [Conexibacter sp.]